MSVSINVPVGLSDGQMIKAGGMGDFANGMFGDIIFKVEIVNQDGFEKSGGDLIYVKYMSIDELNNDTIDIPHPHGGIKISLPEFTCKCPFSGYPDFATIHITYVPNEKVVELKGIKFYINSYRDRYISHEESINQILDDFVAACDPLEVQIQGDFNPRGNVHTWVEVDAQGNPMF